MGGWAHLARRFCGALRPGGPAPADTAWVAEVLNPGELGLWQRQPGQDRRHTVEVARRVEGLLAATPYAGDTRWLACALLHDIGKVESGLGVPGRVVATLVGKAARARARGRIASYLDHARLGAELVRAAGGREEVAQWAADHHGGLTSGLPGPVVTALVEADDD